MNETSTDVQYFMYWFSNTSIKKDKSWIFIFLQKSIDEMLSIGSYFFHTVVSSSSSSSFWEAIIKLFSHITYKHIMEIFNKLNGQNVIHCTKTKRSKNWVNMPCEAKKKKKVFHIKGKLILYFSLIFPLHFSLIFLIDSLDNVIMRYLKKFLTPTLFKRLYGVLF